MNKKQEATAMPVGPIVRKKIADKGRLGCPACIKDPKRIKRLLA
jgi:hypothetical protein